MIFDPGTKIVFQGQQAEQRATQLCEQYPDTTVRISARVVRLLEPYSLTAIPLRRLPARAAQTVALLLVACFFLPAAGMAVGLGGPSGVGRQEMTLGGVWPAPAVSLGVVDLDPKEVALGVLGLLASLIGYHFVFRKYIRDSAGVTDAPSQTTITNQPLTIKGAIRYVAHEELDARLVNYVTTDNLRETEQRLDHKIEENFRALDEKRSHSIGELHKHLTNTTEKLWEKIDEGTQRGYIRTDALAQQVGVLIGEVKHLTSQAQEATRAAQAASVAAASAANGRKQ